MHAHTLYRPATNAIQTLARVCIATIYISSLLLFAQPVVAWTSTHTQIPRSSQSLSASSFLLVSSSSPSLLSPSVLFSSSDRIDDDDNREEEDAWYENLDVLLDGDNDLYGDDTEEDWVPDAEKARGRRPRGSRDLIPANEVLGDSYNNKKSGADTTTTTSNKERSNKKERPSPYTEDEEELIAAMGGKEKKEKASSREIGFLGDSTLREIARDYSVPICYLADVLAMWGVPVPINVNDRLGDLVTGEQAFALVEAVNTLDMGYLNDRYSNQNLLQVCDGWQIDIKDAFEFAVREGWSLPFGVRTNLRVEQEDELLRVCSNLYREVDDD